MKKRKIPAASKAPRARSARQPLGRDAWLEAARRALIEEGTAGVEVKKLARRLGVTRGGFYWFFKSRDQLLDELIKYWADASMQLFERVLEPPGRDGMDEYLTLTMLWITEDEYDPKWDGAVRDWARTSPKVLKVVQAVDDKRIAILEQIYRDMGFTGLDAHIRARVLYYHQVGYYALGVRETRKQRLDLIPYYARVLTGRQP
jgi:AcrR family transcriptional regulator